MHSEFRNRLHQLLERCAVPGLIRYVVLFNALVFILHLISPGYLSVLELDPAMVLHGQIWRLVTWIFIPETLSPFWIFFSLLFLLYLGDGLETAMGAAIECFQGALAIEVPRSRFAPVKTTSDLFALRLDAYEVLENGQVRLAPSRQGIPPVITLSDEYKLVDGIESLGLPSLLDCRSLKIQGPVHFEPGVLLRGDVMIENSSPTAKTVQAGIYENQSIKL
jgi:hypothetical protein